MDRLSAAVEARGEDRRPVVGFDGMVRAALLDQTGEAHFLLCLAFAALVAEHCPATREHVAATLDVLLFSDFLNASEGEGAFSSLTGRALRGKCSGFTVTASGAIEAWMATRARNFHARARSFCASGREPPVSPSSPSEARAAAESAGEATFWRVEIRFDAGEFWASRRRRRRATPHAALVVAEGRETEAVHRLWKFFKWRDLHPGNYGEYVKVFARAASVFGPAFCEAVRGRLFEYFTEYRENMRLLAHSDAGAGDGGE